MPSSKVFAAILAALAVADASPCKPKPVTTSGSTAAVVTTSGSTDILSSTATTETAATTTTEAACSHYTPYTEIVPADCGKTGVAPNCADKVIGSPITVTDYAQCGNTCGMTVGCKSFSIKGSSCTLYNALVSSLGYTFSEGSDASHFYDLDLCFGCGEGTTTSGTETATGSQTTGTETGTSATGSATETTGTASAGTTTTTGSETETSATGSETGTTTATGSETETSGTAHATGTTDTETSATGSQTETTTAPGATTETSATETLTANTDTTTAAATTTTSAGCTAYTQVANPPYNNCNVRGSASGGASMSQLATYGNTASVNDCALKCANYHDATKPSDKCLSFALDGSNTCYGMSAFFNNLAGLGDSNIEDCARSCGVYHDTTKPSDKCVSFALDESHTCYLYKVPVSGLNVDATSTPVLEFYDFEACYSCDEGGATTTIESGTTTTEESGSSTTEAIVGSTTTTEAGSGTTTTTAAGVDTTATTTTEAGAESSTTEAASTTTDSVCTGYTPVPNPPSTNCAVKGKTYKTYISTDTGSSAAPVCTNYIPLPNAPSTCGKQGKVSCRSTQKLGQATSVTDVNACGKLCGTTLTCKTFSYTPKFRSTGGYCQLYSAPLAQLSFTPCNTGVKFYDLDTCYTCSNAPTPTPPATCSKYVPAFEKCAKDTHCGTRGEICQEEKINVVGDASCLENCAKSCIDYGKECKYFSYQPAFYNSAAKCTLYKSGKINKKSTSWVKFYEQDCFKCQQSK
ncbi:hypothetical protein FPRO03_09212 [Fusarium proliferatum]|nr:hypothetical protein FPRO03_09212 [Fusarium proliferatum]